MKKLFALVFVALLISVLGAGIKKTLYKDYGIVVFHPDSMVVHRAHTTIWGNLYVLSSDSTDTMSMTPDKMTIDSITITDYLHCTDDVRFDSTLYFTDGGADTSSIVQDGTNLKFASDNPFAMSRQLTFTEDVDRTGEGTILFANAIPIGMTTPGDCQGMKTEFKYGVSPTLTGGGKVIQGLMLKMTMDQRWKFASANRNADVRGIGVQAELNDSLGGMLEAIYANAYTDIASNKQIIGEHTTGAYGVGMCAIEARTEIKGAGALTVPHIAGLYVLHRRMGTGGVTGDYHAIHIENSQGTGAISGTETAIHFEPNTMAPPGANFDYGIDMEPVAFGTADVRLSSSATIINPDDDTIKITEAVIELIGDALLDDVTIDSALTVEGKAVFNDTVMLGDSADKMILPKGSAIELYDTTDTDKFQIYDDGTHSVFASVNPFTMNRSLWLLGDTLFLTDGGADTCYIVNNGTELMFAGDIVFRINNQTTFYSNLSGMSDGVSIMWYGNKWSIDHNNNDQLAMIVFHNEDSIKVDTTGATGHRLSWTGAGGMEIRDGTGADTARWYNDGTNTILSSDNPFGINRQVTFLEDASRTGEGTCMFANGIPIGMTTPGDCQGMKMEFDYGVDPDTSGAGKIAQGLMLKMTMDKKWNFLTADRNADVRGASIQVELNNSLGGMLDGIYANAFTDIATNKTIIGEHTTGAFGVGMCAIEARTEIKGAGTLTVPHIAGLYILHRRMGAGGVTGDYHAIHIENSQNTGAISGTETAIHFEPNTMAPPGGSFDYGVDMNAVSFGTADHRLSSGATIINPNDDTLTINEAVVNFSDEVLIDDGNLIVADGQKIVVTDGTEADSFEIYHDGTNLIFETNEPIKLGSGNVHIAPGDTLYIESATFSAFAIYATGTDLYVFGTGADDIHLQAGDICVDGDLTVDGGIIADNIVTNVCDTVASAATVTLGNYNNFVITGTANMDSIDTAGALPNWGIAYIQFADIASATGLTDGKNLKLEGNFVHSADDMIMLQRRGNIFYELSRSVN